MKNIVFLKLGTMLLIVLFIVSIISTVLMVKANKEKESYIIGKTIYVDAGHGGKDNGASVDSVLEDNINLNISKYLIEKLIDLGAYVITSRSGDYDLADVYDRNRKREDLNNRVRYINKSRPDLFISIHLNAYSSSNVKGAQVFYQNTEKSKLLADIVQGELNNITSKDRKIKNGDYFILNQTKITGVLVECGFLSSPEERIKLNDSNYQIKIADKISRGIVKYFYTQG